MQLAFQKLCKIYIYYYIIIIIKHVKDTVLRTKISAHSTLTMLKMIL